MSKRILIALTSNSRLGDSGKSTGYWLSEVTHFYEPLSKAGFEMDFVSPLGGEAPIDPASLKDKDPLMKDEVFVNKIKNTMTPSQVNPDEYVAIYYPGGHGPMWDLADNEAIANIARIIYENNGVISAVCHGPAGLLNIRLSDGKLLIGEKKVTGLSNMEERLIRKAKYMPFLLENELRKKSAGYSKALPGFTKVIVSGRLITGQNPRSTKELARKTLELLQK